LCDGQTGYTVTKLDTIVDSVIHGLFERLNDVPGENIIEERYSAQTAELRIALTKARAEFQALTAEKIEYETEVLKVIRGESNLGADLLNKLYDEAKDKVTESLENVRALEDKIHNSEELKNSVAKQFGDVRTWADMYDECNLDVKKMILSRLINAVRVKSGYEIELDVALDFKQFLSFEKSTETEQNSAPTANVQDNAKVR
jgi:hypothetical protein